MAATRTAVTAHANTVMGASEVVTLSAAVTVGGTLVVKFAAGDASAFISSVSGGGVSAVWSQLLGLNDAHYGTAVWLGRGVATGTTTVTVTLAASDRRWIVQIEEWAKLGAFEGNATIKSAGPSSGSLTSNAYATTGATDVIIGFMAGWPDPFSTETFTQPSSPWSTDAVIESLGNNFIAPGRQIVSAKASFTYTGSVNQPIEYHAYVLAFAQNNNFGGGCFA